MEQNATENIQKWLSAFNPMKALFSKFIERVDSRLKDLGLSVADLSRSSEIPPSTMSRYLAGTTSPGIDEIEKMAGVLKMPPTWFFESDEKFETLVIDQALRVLAGKFGYELKKQKAGFTRIYPERDE